MFDKEVEALPEGEICDCKTYNICCNINYKEQEVAACDTDNDITYDYRWCRKDKCRKNHENHLGNAALCDMKEKHKVRQVHSKKDCLVVELVSEIYFEEVVSYDYKKK